MIDIDTIRTVQKSLSRYIYAKGFLSWDGIRKACERIIISLPDEEKKSFEDKQYPEFEIFIPLLRNGSAEVCKSLNRSTLLFCMNPHTNIICGDNTELIRGQEFFSVYRTKSDFEGNKNKYRTDIPFKKVFDPLSFLKSVPQIEQQIFDFSEQQIQASSLHYEQNLSNYQYEKRDSNVAEIGIYKLDDRAWTSPYLMDKCKKIRKIPYYAEDPDSMNLARLYVRINNTSFNKPIFEYSKSTQELTCCRYSEMPILMTRALLLFEPKQLLSKEFCTNHPSVPFKKVPEEAIKELKRIFSDKTVIIN